jgi:hypothetical protein
MVEETSSMWNDVLGIGGFIKSLTDPQMLQNAALMMQAITDCAHGMKRIEAKLDILLKESGHDGERQGHAIAALLLEGNGASGTRGRAAAIGTVDNGSGRASAENGGTRRYAAVEDHHRGLDENGKRKR